jgi:hypothetical protein
MLTNSKKAPRAIPHNRIAREIFLSLVLRMYEATGKNCANPPPACSAFHSATR